jgi:hypothetical protein
MDYKAVEMTQQFSGSSACVQVVVGQFEIWLACGSL